MSPWSVALKLPDIILGPLLCAVRGHRWHLFHATTTIRVCDWCGFTVDDPRAPRR